MARGADGREYHAVKLAARIAVGALALALAAGAGAYAFRRALGEAAFARAAQHTVGRDRAAELPDGLHVYLCGSGGPMPDAARAGPCLGVLAGQRAFVFDIGSGGMRRLGRMGFPMARLERVYLTHLHSDHFDGLGELMLQAWVGGGRHAPLSVAGPEGVAEVVAGFNQAYRIDSGFRTAHHGADVADPAGYGAVAETLTVWQFTRRVNRLAVIALPEGSDRVECFKPEAKRIHQAVTACALRLATGFLEPLTNATAAHRRPQIRGNSGRWRCWRRAQELLQNPLAALDRRSSPRIRGHREHAALRQQSAPCGSKQPGLFPRYVRGGSRDSVVPCEVGCQIRHWFGDESRKTQLSASPKR